MGAFGGSAIGKAGMTIASAVTEFAGSVAGDFYAGNSINWSSAIFSAGSAIAFSLIGEPGSQKGGIDLRIKAKNRIKESTNKFNSGKFTSQQYNQSQNDLTRIFSNRTKKLYDSSIKNIFEGIYPSIISGIISFLF